MEPKSYRCIENGERTYILADEVLFDLDKAQQRVKELEAKLNEALKDLEELRLNNNANGLSKL